MKSCQPHSLGLVTWSHTIPKWLVARSVGRLAVNEVIPWLPLAWPTKVNFVCSVLVRSGTKDEGLSFVCTAQNIFR